MLTRRDITSTFGGAVGALLLFLIIVASGLGVIGALYLAGLRDTPSSPSLKTSVSKPRIELLSPAETEPLPELRPEDHLAPATIAALAEIEPAAGPLASSPIAASTDAPHAESNPPVDRPGSETAAIPRPATRIIAETVPTRSYWVEYGAFAREHHAARLSRALSAIGLKATVAPAKGRGGRRLYSVRSDPFADRDAALSVAHKVHQRLGTNFLIHHSRITPAIRAAESPSAAPSKAAAPSARYWVQFGAFAHRAEAVRLGDRLARAGIRTSIIPQRDKMGHAKFYLRSAPLDVVSAQFLVWQAQHVGPDHILIGRTPTTSPHRKGPPRHHPPLLSTRAKRRAAHPNDDRPIVDRPNDDRPNVDRPNVDRPTVDGHVPPT